MVEWEEALLLRATTPYCYSVRHGPRLLLSAIDRQRRREAKINGMEINPESRSAKSQRDCADRPITRSGD